MNLNFQSKSNHRLNVSSRKKILIVGVSALSFMLMSNTVNAASGAEIVRIVHAKNSKKQKSNFTDHFWVC